MKLVKSQYYSIRKISFDRWRAQLKVVKRNEIQKLVNKHENFNAALIKDCKELVTSINCELVSSKSKATIKILKFLRSQQSKMHVIYFKKWINFIKKPQKLKIALKTLDTINNKLCLKFSFKQYKDQIKKQRRAEVIESRMSFLASSTENRIKLAIFHAIIIHKNITQKIKKKILIISHQTHQKTLSKSFKIWSKVLLKCKDHDSKILKQNIISEGRKITENKGNYKDELEKIKGGKQKLELKLQNQGRQILGNSIIRLLKFNLKNAMGIWKRNTIVVNDKEKAMNKIISRIKIYSKQQTMTAWRNWMEFPIIQSVESKLIKKLKERAQLLNTKNIKQNKFKAENKLKYEQKQEVGIEN